MTYLMEFTTKTITKQPFDHTETLNAAYENSSEAASKVDGCK